MTKSQLWDTLGAIGTYEYNNDLQRKTPIKVFLDEYYRLDHDGSVNPSFLYNLTRSQKIAEFGKVIKGKDFAKMESKN